MGMSPVSPVRHILNQQKRRSTDWFGVFLLTVGLFILIFAIIESNKYGWWKSKEIVVIHGTNIVFPADLSFVPFLTAVSILILMLSAAWRAHKKEKEFGHHLGFTSHHPKSPEPFEALVSTPKSVIVPFTHEEPVTTSPSNQKKSVTDVMTFIINPPPNIGPSTPLHESIKAHKTYELKLLEAEALVSETERELKKMIRTVRQRHDALKPAHHASTQPLPYIDGLSRQSQAKTSEFL
jgi:hypothetical protein